MCAFVCVGDNAGNLEARGNRRTYSTRFQGAPQHNYAEGGRGKKKV